MSVQKVCVVCSKAFSVPPSRANTATTCGRACKSLMVRARTIENFHEKACPHCGDTFRFPAWQKARVYCSEPCKWNAESIRWAAAEKPEGGSVTKSSDGYLLEYRPRHPFCSKRGWVLQHRLVMEARLRAECPDSRFLVEFNGSRYLAKSIDVHHKDKVRSNNDPSNLVACTKLAHNHIHNGLPVDPEQVWPPIEP